MWQVRCLLSKQCLPENRRNTRSIVAWRRPACLECCKTAFPVTVCITACLPAPALPFAETGDSTIFNALTLLVVLGTSLITQLAGLSLALGAFLAGLLLAETEYHLQVGIASIRCLPCSAVVLWA